LNPRLGVSKPLRVANFHLKSTAPLFGVDITRHTGDIACAGCPHLRALIFPTLRTIAHYAHVNEQRVFEKWKAFEYGQSGAGIAPARTATVQQNVANPGSNGAPEGNMGHQGENGNRIQIATNSSHLTEENSSRGGAAW